MKEHKRPGLALFIISFAGFFGQMLFLRFLPSNIYLLSYYKNSMLLAIFLGFGIGFLLAKGRRNLVELMPVATLALVCAIIYFNDYLRIDINYGAKEESIWPEFWANPRARSIPVFGVLIVFFTLMALYFIPIGQETMRAMKRLRPLAAYSFNLAGSLAGIITFSIAGWFWTSPVLWFAAFLLPVLLWSFRYSGNTVKALNVVAAALTVFVVFTEAYGPEVWSPYSKIRIYPYSNGIENGFISTTNGNPQVGAMNLDFGYPGPEGKLNLESKRIYEIPYSYLKPERVLIAGAGAGNEAAVALRRGASEIDAVEIDPVFAALGKEISPHRPFADKKVTVHVDDARAFFHRTDKLYDLVVIGFLDSQYHLTHLSNIRTENFVYTYESLKRTKELLAGGGILQVNYNAPSALMRKKLYFMLKDLFGEDLVVYVPEEPVSGNISFVAGPGLKGKKPELAGLIPGKFYNGEGLRFPTDDWPFLYLERMKLPAEYWGMLAAIPILSFALIRTIGGARGLSLKFFLLGVGFMLLETKSITTLALLFGSTSTVVSIVLASILASILLANLAIERFSIKRLRAPYYLLFASLVFLYLFPAGALSGLGWASKLVLSFTLIAMPIFFSSLVFGISFSRSDSIETDFGSNIFGAVAGGMGEYLSMALGFKALYLLALAAYIAAYFSDKRKAGL